MVEQGFSGVIQVHPNDLCLITLGSMTSSSSLGSNTTPPAKAAATLPSSDDSWALWHQVSRDSGRFGHPSNFSTRIPESAWLSFTTTLQFPLWTFPQALHRVYKQRARHRRAHHLQRQQLDHEHHCPSSTTLHRPTRRRAGLLGLRLDARCPGQLHSETHDRVLWRRDLRRAASSSSFPTTPHSRERHHHTLLDAIYHVKISDPWTRRPTCCHTKGEHKSGLPRPIRRDREGRRFHDRVQRAKRAGGGIWAYGIEEEAYKDVSWRSSSGRSGEGNKGDTGGWHKMGKRSEEAWGVGLSVVSVSKVWNGVVSI